jgi:thiamine biosynthesis lipoprotein ApbE
MMVDTSPEILGFASVFVLFFFSFAVFFLKEKNNEIKDTRTEVKNKYSKEDVDQKIDNIFDQIEKGEKEKDKLREARRKNFETWVKSEISLAIEKVSKELKSFFMNFWELKSHVDIELSKINANMEKMNESFDSKIREVRHLIQNIEKGEAGKFDIFINEFKEIKKILNDKKI